jgi:hypothetical protein
LQPPGKIISLSYKGSVLRVSYCDDCFSVEGIFDRISIVFPMLMNVILEGRDNIRTLPDLESIGLRLTWHAIKDAAFLFSDDNVWILAVLRCVTREKLVTFL